MADWSGVSKAGGTPARMSFGFSLSSFEAQEWMEGGERNTGDGVRDCTKSSTLSGDAVLGMAQLIPTGVHERPHSNCSGDDGFCDGHG